MRSRGNTLYVKRDPVSFDLPPKPTDDNTESFYYRIETLNDSNLEVCKGFEIFGQNIDESSLEHLLDTRTDSRSTVGSRESLARRNSEQMHWDELFDEVRPVNKSEIMIVGSRGVGKHTFLGGLFPQLGVEPKDKSEFDLETRKTTDLKMDKLMKFWLINFFLYRITPRLCVLMNLV
jgi:hypothetical protein